MDSLLWHSNCCPLVIFLSTLKLSRHQHPQTLKSSQMTSQRRLVGHGPFNSSFLSPWTLFGGSQHQNGCFEFFFASFNLSVSSAQINLASFRTSWTLWPLQYSTVKKDQIWVLLRMGFVPSSKNAASTSTNSNCFEMMPRDRSQTKIPSGSPWPWLLPLITSFFLIILIFMVLSCLLSVLLAKLHPLAKQNVPHKVSHPTPFVTFVPDTFTKRPFRCCWRNWLKGTFIPGQIQLFTLVLYFILSLFLQCSVAPAPSASSSGLAVLAMGLVTLTLN